MGFAVWSVSYTHLDVYKRQGIYGVAAEYGAKALCICTVSDHIRTHEQTTAEERQLTFNDMIEIALESVLIGDKA